MKIIVICIGITTLPLSSAFAGWAWTGGTIPNLGDAVSGNTGTFSIANITNNYTLGTPSNVQVTWSDPTGVVSVSEFSNYEPVAGFERVLTTTNATELTVDFDFTAPVMVRPSGGGALGVMINAGTAPGMDMQLSLFDEFGTRITQSNLVFDYHPLGGGDPDAILPNGDASWTNSSGQYHGVRGGAPTSPGEQVSKITYTLDLSGVPRDGDGNAAFYFSFDGQVPEPGSSFLAILSGAILLIRRRRR